MSWDDGKHTKVKRVQLTFDDVIRSIEVEYDGTSLKSQPRGTAGTKIDGFTLSSDEYITEVNGYYKTTFSGEVITSLTFKTNKRTYGTYGNKTSSYFSVAAPKDNQIVGFLGSSSHALNSIDAHFAPAPPPGSTGAKPGASGIGSDSGSIGSAGTNPGADGTRETEKNAGGSKPSSGSAGTNPGASAVGNGETEKNAGGSKPSSGSAGTNPGASAGGNGETEKNVGGSKPSSGKAGTNPGANAGGNGGTEKNAGGSKSSSGSARTNPGASAGGNGETVSNIGDTESNAGGSKSNDGANNGASGIESNAGSTGTNFGAGGTGGIGNTESNAGGSKTNSGNGGTNDGASGIGSNDGSTGTNPGAGGGTDSNIEGTENNVGGKETNPGASGIGNSDGSTGTSPEGTESNADGTKTNTGGKESNTGSESNTNSSPQKLEAQGGKGGNQWDDGTDHDGVMKIHVAVGGLGIEQIRFDYVKNGQLKEGPFHGVKGRGGTSTIEISHPDEYLVSVEGLYDSSNIIQGIQFQSNKHTSQYFGYKYYGDGTQFSLQVNEKKIIGFHGFADSHLNSLGAYFVPISSSSSSLTPPPNKVKAQGGSYGETFDDGAFDHVRKVYVGQGDSGVAYVKFDYEKDGKKETQEHGKMTLLGPEEFEVDSDDYITSMEVYVDKVYGYKSEIVVALTFKTFKGETSPRFGIETENKYEVKDGKGGKLAGFHGKASDVLYAIGAYFIPAAN
ncbi:unnamed protein product [Arabidopsis thaliana]|uniref:Jacalin-type lectin domain-containing protein n=1 Tax=Arabidopsis thaliana TaxID=3702 RepID=A0A654EHP8_ARATH|nr:unnamed protein product [Arabidopsis thaliana]